MSSREIKKLLKECLEKEEAFLNLIEEFCKEIWPEEGEGANSMFCDILYQYENFEEYGCFQSLEWLKEQRARHNVRIQELIAKREEEKT